jgi:hypothetical protein
MTREKVKRMLWCGIGMATFFTIAPTLFLAMGIRSLLVHLEAEYQQES